MPDVVENVSGVTDQKGGQLTIVVPGTRDRAFIDFLAFFIEEERDGRHISLGAVEADVALALLLGIVERMRVKERPDQLAADVFEAEFEMGVLVDGMVTAVEGGGADVEALFVRDFFGADQARGIASSGGSDGGIEWMREGIAKRDARWSGLD